MRVEKEMLMERYHVRRCTNTSLRSHIFQHGDGAMASWTSNFARRSGSPMRMTSVSIITDTAMRVIEAMRVLLNPWMQIHQNCSLLDTWHRPKPAAWLTMTSIGVGEM